MRMRHCFKRISLLLMLAVLVTVSGVFAAWHYAVNPPERQTVEVPIALGTFVYPPEQVLPHDPDHAESHLDAIDSILTSSKGGLNSDKNKSMLIPENLERYGGVLYSRQNVQGGNLKNMFDTDTSENIYFVIAYVSEREIAVYTMSKPIVDVSDVGDNVIVYRTLIENNDGIWIAYQAEVGHAHLRQIVVTGETILSFDPRLDEWHLGMTPGVATAAVAESEELPWAEQESTIPLGESPVPDGQGEEMPWPEE